MKEADSLEFVGWLRFGSDLRSSDLTLMISIHIKADSLESALLTRAWRWDNRISFLANMLSAELFYS